MLEAKKKVTASLVPFCVYVLSTAIESSIATFSGELEDGDANQNLDNGVSETILACLVEMRKDFDSRWGNPDDTKFTGKVRRSSDGRQFGIHPGFILAHALDPRFLSLEFIELESDRTQIWDDILKKMISAAKQRKSPVTDQNEQTTFMNMRGTTDEEPILKKHKASSLVSALANAATKRHNEKKRALPNNGRNDHGICLVELHNYKSQEQIPFFTDDSNTVMSDPLPWWNERKNLFPNLYLLAVYYLSRPASSAMSESIFSSGGDIFTWNTRCDNFENKVMLKRNIHKI